MITGTADILSNLTPVVIDGAFGNFCRLLCCFTLIAYFNRVYMQEWLYKHGKQLCFIITQNKLIYA